MHPADSPEAELAGDFLAMAGRLAAELDELRAIIEGRTVPPTDAEIDAMREAYGQWMCVRISGGVPSIVFGEKAKIVARWKGYRWWALDATGKPCAWPKVSP